MNNDSRTPDAGGPAHSVRDEMSPLYIAYLRDQLLRFVGQCATEQFRDECPHRGRSGDCECDTWADANELKTRLENLCDVLRIELKNEGGPMEAVRGNQPPGGEAGCRLQTFLPPDLIGLVSENLLRFVEQYGDLPYRGICPLCRRRWCDVICLTGDVRSSVEEICLQLDIIDEVLSAWEGGQQQSGSGGEQ